MLPQVSNSINPDFNNREHRPYFNKNTLDCDQSNYSSRSFLLQNVGLLNLVKPKIAPSDPPTTKTPA